MDRNSHLVRQLVAMDESYLTAFSNKGTYKRAVKDWSAAPKAIFKLRDDVATVQIADETTVVFSKDVKSYSCTCDARTVCKHIIMAILALKESMGDEDKAVQNFSPLLSIDVRKLVTASVWEEIVFRQQFSLRVEIEEGTALLISLPDEGIVVRFLQPSSIAQAICTCKAEGVCRHKAEAVYLYQTAKNVHHDHSSRATMMVQKEQLAPFKEILTNMVQLGLSRLTEHTAQELQQLSVQARALRLGRLENGLRRLASDVELYRSKHLAFSPASYRTTLADLYEHVLLLEKGRREDRQRASYYEVPPVTLYGLGAAGWKTKSDYVGVTYYFYSKELEKWLTYSQARPLFYEERSITPQLLYEQAAPWGIGGNGAVLSRSIVYLQEVRLNEEWELSASMQTKGEIVGNVVLKNLEVDFLSSWSQLVAAVKQEQAPVYGIVAADVGEWTKEEQHEILPLIDEEGAILQLHVIRTPETAAIPRRVKAAMKQTRQLLVKPIVAHGRLFVQPLVLYTESGAMINVTLTDAEGTQDARAAMYDE